MTSEQACGCKWDGPIQVLTCGEHNVAAKNLNRAQAQLTRLELEVDFLRRLETHLADRRKMEPRHSREDHTCPECETLAELQVFRRATEKRG